MLSPNKESPYSPLHLELFFTLSVGQLIVTLPNSVSFDMYLDKIQNRNKDSCVSVFFSLFTSTALLGLFKKDMIDSEWYLWVGSHLSYLGH